MGNKALDEAERTLPDSGLSPIERAIVPWLANWVPDDTRLVWRGQAKLCGVTGRSENTTSEAVAGLVRAGWLTIWRRPGKVPLYLFHPLGPGSLPAVDAGDVRAHLALGNFTRDEIERAIAWRVGMGDLTAGANSRRALANPPTTRGGGIGYRASTPSSRGGDHPATWGTTPPPRGGDTKWKPNGNLAHVREARPGLPDGPGVAAAGDGQPRAEAMSIDLPPAAPLVPAVIPQSPADRRKAAKLAMHADAGIDRLAGDPREVLATLIANRDSHIRTMGLKCTPESAAEDVATIAQHQRRYGLAPRRSIPPAATNPDAPGAPATYPPARGEPGQSAASAAA